MVHTRDSLKQYQSLPLESKIVIAEQRIKQWYEHWNGQVYVSFSGGKDSTVLLNIARRMYPQIRAAFVDTGLEYPEIREFVKTKENVDWVRPKNSFNKVIEKYGYPMISKEVSCIVYNYRKDIAMGKDNTWCIKKLDGTMMNNATGKLSMYNCSKWKFLLDAPFKISDKCCYHMKKSPIHSYAKDNNLYGITGQLACESQLRLSQWIKAGCNAFNANIPISNPMSVWTEQDVLKYIYQNKLAIASVYGNIISSEDGVYSTTGVARTGCMFCMYGVHLEKGNNRFQQMKITHPKQYDYCINKLGLGTVLDYIGVPYK